ncbi:MAG: hypothetical protein WD013_01720 [Gemmatimonadota bacterium]
MATRSARQATSHSPALVLCWVILALTATEATAQVQEIEGPLIPETEASILGFLNDPNVLRLPGGSRVPAGSEIVGDVAVLGGSLELGGEVSGRLLIVNGDLTLLPGSAVGEEVTVVGGILTGADGADLDAGAVVYQAPLRYRIDRGRIEAMPGDDLSRGFLQTDLGFGQARLGLRAGAGYNRVEGLPVRFGPVLRTAGSNPLTLEAFAIWRSVSGLNLETDRLGYFLRLRQAVGGRGIAAIGATAHDEVIAIEDQGISDLEASLATFLLRDDFRDYYQREGWSAFATLQPQRTPVEIALTFRQEDHRTAPIRDPWTLRSEDRPWRALPLAAEGRVQTVEASLQWDTRNDPVSPSDGWLLDLDLRRQVGGTLQLPPSASAPPDDDPLPPLEEAADLPRFTRGLLDVRRYARMGPTSRLSLRGVFAGSLDDNPLPPQYQFALGGEGSLPGHRRFSVGCSARSTLRIARTGEADRDGRTPEAVYPAYGCDRMLLFQVEFQSSLPVSWNPLPEDWQDSELSPLLDFQPIWALFLDAGRGWARGDLGSEVLRPDSSTRADVGVGLFLGPLGLYWSYPLNEQDRGVNFFVRLQKRF